MLMQIKDTDDFNQVELDDELIVNLKPSTLSDQNKLGMIQFENVRKLQAVENSEDERIKVSVNNEVVGRNIMLTQEIIGNAIVNVALPDGNVVADQAQIREWLGQLGVTDFKKIEEKISREPNNIDVIQTYGFLLFNKLNADSATEKVPNYEGEEVKMVDMLSKAGEGKPEEGTAFFYAGSHYWNKALRVKDQIGLINDTVRIFNSSVKPDKTGKTPPPPKALTDRRDNYRKLQESNVDKALPFLLKSVPGIEKTSAKGKTEMQTYKRLIDQLIEIYSTKRQLAKLPADKAKFEAEEKKWDALYAKITEK
jgi:hypothetical protein